MSPPGKDPKKKSISQVMTGVTSRIFLEVFLVVFFGLIELPSWNHFRGQRPSPLPGAIELFFHSNRHLPLLVCMIKNRGAVLCTYIISLSIPRRRVVKPEKVAKEAFKRKPPGIKNNLDRLRVPCAARLHIRICRIFKLTTGVASLSFKHPIHCTEQLFHSPETSTRQSRNFSIHRPAPKSVPSLLPEELPRAFRLTD